MKEGKAFHISQKEVLNAYKAVKANKGAGGIDGIELEEFDKDWKNRLYVLWNRMSSGSYYSKPSFFQRSIQHRRNLAATGHRLSDIPVPLLPVLC